MINVSDTITTQHNCFSGSNWDSTDFYYYRMANPMPDDEFACFRQLMGVLYAQEKTYQYHNCTLDVWATTACVKRLHQWAKEIDKGKVPKFTKPPPHIYLRDISPIPPLMRNDKFTVLRAHIAELQRVTARIIEVKASSKLLRQLADEMQQEILEAKRKREARKAVEEEARRKGEEWLREFYAQQSKPLPASLLCAVMRLRPWCPGFGYWEQAACLEAISWVWQPR